MNRKQKPKGASRVRVTPARWTAYQVLRDWAERKGYAEDLLAAHWARKPLILEDLNLSKELVYGVLRRLRLLDFWIDRLAKQGIGSLPEEVVDCLRLGLYQLAFLDRVPPHAAVNESVNLCEAAGLGALKALVNGCLRGFQARRAEFDRELQAHPRCEAIRSSHPDWLFDWALCRWGQEKALAWVEQNNLPPRIYLRPMTSRLLPDWGSLDFGAAEGEASQLLLARIPGATQAEDGRSAILPEGTVPGTLTVLKEGLAVVQDTSAQIAVDLLDPRPGERVYDCCSAPGGKTLQVADRTRGKANVVALDVHSHRLERVRENLERCGYSERVETRVQDLLAGWPEELPAADAVLLDVPCSGLGTLRRRVDLRYRIGPEDLAELAEKSRKLIRNAALAVARGGRMVYSTCTLAHEENRETVRDFLREHPLEWRLIEERTVPAWLDEPEGPAPMQLPDCDGAYVALLRRIGEEG